MTTHNTNCVPVRYKDRDYPSIKAAAKDIGVARSTISKHLDKYGHLDNLLKYAPSEPVKVTMGNKEWTSIGSAARELGFAPSAIQQRLERHGHIEGIGVTRANVRETTIGDTTFPTRTAAAKALRVPFKCVSLYARGLATEWMKEEVERAYDEWRDRND